MWKKIDKEVTSAILGNLIDYVNKENLLLMCSFKQVDEDENIIHLMPLHEVENFSAENLTKIRIYTKESE